MSAQNELFERDPQMHTRLRVFFALLPDDAAIQRITALQASLRREHGLRGADITPARLHITLYFVGPYTVVRDSLVLAATRAAERVRVAPFDVMLDRVKSFPGRPDNSPLVLTASDDAPAVEVLRQSLAEALETQGIVREQSPTPHLTLLYDRIAVPETPIEPIRWQAREFVLVKSYVGEGRHERMGQWALGGKR